jgi:ribosome modulation factor
MQPPPEYLQGCHAALAGMAARCNPYPQDRDPTAHQHWLSGWTKAQVLLFLASDTDADLRRREGLARLDQIDADLVDLLARVRAGGRP